MIAALNESAPQGEAAKHNVTEAALKYHLYKDRRATAKPTARAPRVLPIRVERESSVVEGAIRLAAGQLP